MKYAALIVLMVTMVTSAYASSHITGAWASTDDVAKCTKAPLSLFMSDGAMVIFESARGSIHSVGVWRKEGKTLYITHNEAPFPSNGTSNPEVALTIVQLNQSHFVTRNKTGKERVRVRCTDIQIKGAGGSHHH